MTKKLITFFLFLVSVSYGQIATKATSGKSKKNVIQTNVVKKQEKDCFTFKFCYLETQNDLYTPVLHHIEVFLDEKVFSEKNLKTLFVYIAKKNPKPSYLTIVVNTNWAKLDSPSSHPGTGLSEQPDPPDKYDYLQAIYYRRGNKEYFRYSPAIKVEDSDFKTVVLRPNTKKKQ